MHRRLSGFALGLLALCGCPITASLGHDASAGTSTSGGSSSGSGASTSSGAGSSTTTTGGAQGATSSGSTGEPGSTSITLPTDASGFTDDGDPSSGEWPPLLCEGPVNPSCQSCLRQNCCAALEQCFETPLCACLLGCLEFAPDFFSCLDIPACDGGPDADLLQSCAMTQCPQQCGFS